MEASAGQTETKLLDSIFRIPQEVVFRSFAHETVVLNLTTGRYHGLNPTAGTMLAELERGMSVREAAGVLAARFGRPVSEVENDLCGLCVDLVERGLIESAEPGSPASRGADGG